VWLMKAARRRKHAMARSKMNFRGENNGHHLMAQETMPPPQGDAAAQRCRSEVSSRSRQVCTISAETFGNGASTLTKEAAAQPVVIGECCAVAPGRRAIVWKCNPLIATSSIAMIATSFTDLVA